MNKPQMYQMIADENELHWFFDNVIQKPQVNESYSAVFVSRHKKLTDEELKTFGLTRKEGEFLSTVTFKMRNIKDASRKNDPGLWTFEQFLSRVKRFNVDVGAYTTGTGDPLPTKTLAVIFYVNPGDDMKVCRNFVDEYNTVNEAISKAMLNGKTTEDNLQSYQWFGNAESTIKHLKANCKGSKYWMDFDIDVPKWWKDPTKGFVFGGPAESTKEFISYYDLMRGHFDDFVGRGNYVIVDTSGGYHVLVKVSAIHSNPHDVCRCITLRYESAVKYNGEEPYVDEKGNVKFECVVNDSQIPGLPLPGTYQYGRPVTVLNKEDFVKQPVDLIKPVEGKWYPAYAYHKWAGPEDVDLDKPFDTHEEAMKYACSFLCDDDNANAFLFKDGYWWKLSDNKEPVKYSSIDEYKKEA